MRFRSLRHWALVVALLAPGLVVRAAAAGQSAAQSSDSTQGPPGGETTDPAERERRAAALAERAGKWDADAIAALVPLIHDPDSRVRYHATWGLARAGSPAVPTLLAELRRRSDDEERARIANLLGRIGLAASAAIPDLRAALADPQSSLAAQAAYALGSLRAREAVPDLVGAYAASRRITSQRQVIRALRRIGADQAARLSQRELVASVRTELEQGDAATRAATLRYTADLYRAVRDDGDAEFPTRRELRSLVPGLVAALDDPDPERVLTATRALTLAGRDAAPAARPLASLLADPGTYHEAMRALRAIGSAESERIVAERLAFEALEDRVRVDYALRDHQGRTWLVPFRVAGTAEEGLRLSARFLYPGREPRAPERVVVGLESTSVEPRFEGVGRLTWLADGTRIEMDDLDRTWSRSQLGGVIEELSGTLSLRDFLVVSQAQQLSARIGAVGFAVSDPDRAALRHFAGKIPAAAASASEP